MEKLKEDCIDTDERLEYMKAIAEIYVPNLLLDQRSVVSEQPIHT